MNYNKESLMLQIAEAKNHIRRLETLVNAEMADIPDSKVPIYCCMKAALQLANIAKELNGGEDVQEGAISSKSLRQIK